MSLRIGIDHIASARKGLQNVIDLWKDSSKVETKALARALKDTARWLQSRSTRQIAQATRLPAKVVKGRFKMNSIRDGADSSVTITVNLNPVRAHALGAPTQHVQGASVGRFHFPGAFVANVYGYKSVYKRKGKPRFPVVEQRIDLKDSQAILEEGVKQAPFYYEKRLQHYETFWGGV